MKKINCIFVLVLFLLCLGHKSQADDMLEISCEMVKTIRSKNHNTYYQQIREYAVWGFYIDDKNQMLFYAPSSKHTLGTPKVFSKDYIQMDGVPYADNSSGTININRNSGNIHMSFENRYAIVSFVGSCNKADNINHKF